MENETMDLDGLYAPVVCSKCDGHARHWRNGDDEWVCPTCDGTGEVSAGYAAKIAAGMGFDGRCEECGEWTTVVPAIGNDRSEAYCGKCYSRSDMELWKRQNENAQEYVREVIP